MTEDLLTTKLHIPKLRTQVIQRSSLIDRVELSELPNVTLVSAPAGFGKTTLLCSWAAQSTRPVAWISLDEGDNDPTRLLSYIAASLMSVEKSVGDDALAAVLSTKQPPIERTLSLLVNDIAEHDRPLSLVLDDVHLLRADEAHRVLLQIVEHIPANLQILIATRIDPPWPLARMRASNLLQEIRVRELRFSAEETSRFLLETMQLRLSSSEIGRLDAKTEGWIAGVQMAALSMQGNADIDSFLEGFEGSNRYILDYLLEEVLEQQPPKLQRFLMQTSILRKMNGELCDEVTGDTNGRQTLHRLEDINLFLVPLDDARDWYRYHHLFSGLLTHRLSNESPEMLQELHARACTWNERHGYLLEAMHHAQASGDKQRMVALLEANALGLIYRGAIQTLIHWLAELPPTLVSARPQLTLALAWAAVFNGDLKDTNRQLKRARQGLADTNIKETERTEIEGQIESIEAYLAWFRGDITSAREHCERALALLPASETLTRAWAIQVYGAMLRSEGLLEESEAPLIEAVQMYQRLGLIHPLLDAIWELTVLEHLQGKLNAIDGRCEETFSLLQADGVLDRRRIPALSYIHGRKALILLEWNDLSGANEHARMGVELASRWGMVDAIVQCNTIYARVLRAQGEHDQALEMLAKAKLISSEISEWYIQMLEGYEAISYLETGKIEAAKRWLDHCGISPRDDVKFPRDFEYRILARMLLGCSRLEHAPPPKELAPMLKQLEGLYLSSGATTPLLETLILKALMHHLQGKEEAALQALASAVQLGQQEGFIGTFLVYGEPVRMMLGKLPQEGISSQYLGELLIAFHPTAVKVTPSPGGPPVLVEPLSERELDVLRYLNSALTSAEIAAEMYIAVSTVRSHIKSIYQKLAVHRRLEAVERARELGLL